MRHAVFAILIAIPAVLVTWIVSRGIYGQPGDRCSTEEHDDTTTATDPDAALRRLFTTPMGNFTINGQMELYDKKGLFNYINGAAPLYINHHFRRLAAAEMAVAGSELTCDVYDMAGTENAASIYEAENTPQAKPADFGDAGRSSSMALVFRQGPYYVKLTAFDTDAEAALPKLAALLAERMP